jgi:putative two-component system response regulator
VHSKDNSTVDILVVDDEAMIREMMVRILNRKGYGCRTAADAKEARAKLVEKVCDLLICDIYLPGESGMDFTQYVLANHADTAAIMATGEVNLEIAQSMINMGVYDYITKPLEHNGIVISVENALRRRELEIANRRYQRDLERMVDDRTLSLKNSMEKLETTMAGIIRAITSVVETRDPYTAGHQRRVADLAKAMAAKTGLSPEEIEGIHMAALIHDLGKIRVPAEILSKPGRLTANEFNIIKEHSQVGYDIIKEIEFPWPVATIVLQHHERLDGSGYPSGLSGDDILVESRIIAVADVVEAMASHRPYRPGLGIDAALEEILKNSGTRYDADLGRVCAQLFREDHYQMA